jgi:hypothetical protein
MAFNFIGKQAFEVLFDGGNMKPYPDYSRLFCVILIVFVFVFFNFAAKAQVFSSPSGDINIPDGANAPLCTSPGAYVCKNVTVSGLPAFAILQSATVALVDDENVGSLEVEVRGPGGSPTFLPFSRTGSTSPSDCGDNSDTEGEYTFRDSAVGNWWTTAAGLNSTGIMPTGTYFPSFPGGGPAPPAGTPNNTMTQTFLGVTNGTWQVCIRDWGDNGGARLQLARLTFTVPTAAASLISGQVVTAGGSGIRNAIVTISGDDLPAPLTTKTGTFGYYSFPGIPTGGTYIVTVYSKRYTFNSPSQIINVQDDLADVNFIAEEK